MESKKFIPAYSQEWAVFFCRIWLLVGCAMSLTLVSFAQERGDSLRVSQDMMIEELLGKEMPMLPSQSTDLGIDLPPLELPLTMNLYMPPIIRKGDYLPRWGTGYMYGANSYSGSMLYGYNASAMAGLHQSIGENLSFNLSATFSKYSVYYNTASFNTSINWRPSKYFELTAFANYMPGSFLSAVQLVPVFEWGGYATFQTDTEVPFGVDVGVRDSYDPMTGHYVSPIVQPFVKLGGAKLGIDVGPIIRNSLESKRDGWRGGMNPIPQPIKAIPQVAPRR